MDSGSHHRSSVGHRASLALLAGIGLAAVLFRVGLLNAPAEFDELYHLLAARGLLETGRPMILDGEYDRGLIFTRIVAGAMWAFSDQELSTARLVSVVFGALIPVVLFLWLRAQAGMLVAGLAAALAVVWPQGILEAQFVRFYAAQVLAFLVGAAALHQAVGTGRAFRPVWAIVAAVAWAAALHLQLSTAIGILGALGWAALAILFAHVPGWRARAMGVGALAIAGLLALGLAAVTGVLSRAWAFYRWTPGHAAELRDYAGFYFNQLETQYAALWLATPVLALVALRGFPRVSTYCLFVFGTCFLAHSFGGMKALRYLSYAMPFLFAIWAMAAVTMGRALFDRAGWIGVAPVALVALFSAALLTSFPARSLQLALGEGLPERGDWRDAARVVGDWIDAPFIATTRELHMLAHVGPYDLLISSSRLSEIPSDGVLGLDPRTGRPVLGSPDALGAVIACHGDGVLVTSPFWWTEDGHGASIARLLTANGLTLSQREEGAVLAIRWTSPDDRAPECGDLPF